MQHKIFTLTAVFGLILAASAFAAEQGGQAPTITAQEVTGQAQAGYQAVADTGKPVEVNNTFCPLSGEKAGEHGPIVKHEYKGKIYNFCCKMCLKDFDKDPEKYIKAMEEKEKAQAAASDASESQEKK